MSLLDRLLSPDDVTRLQAAEQAARDGGVELVDTLLDLALHDPAEVRTTGGVAEVHRSVSDAAAQAVKAILDRRDRLDPRIRSAVTDLARDDERVARLLYHLGPNLWMAKHRAVTLESIRKLHSSPAGTGKKRS